MNQIPTDPGQPAPISPPSRWSWALVARILVACIVVAALGVSVSKAVDELRNQPISLSEVRWGMLVLAVLSYSATMFLSWSFWHRLLLALGQRPKKRKSLRAFFASQLGKYVPGKAMVVVLRTDLVRDENVAVAPAAASVFVETLTWIFVGATLASLLLVFGFREFPGLQVAAVVMMLVAGAVTWPPLFQKIVVWIRPAATSGMTYQVDLRTMMAGWLLLVVGWGFNGLSLWLVVGSLPSAPLGIEHFPLMVAAVTLATVGGFVSLLPGGLGVREMVMIPLLGSQFGVSVAVLAAVLIRFVWLSAELILSGIIYLLVMMSYERKAK